MNALQKELERTFQAVSAIAVAGDGVERMAVARDSLRRAYQMAGQQDRPEFEAEPDAEDEA